MNSDKTLYELVYQAALDWMLEPFISQPNEAHAKWIADRFSQLMTPED